MLIVEIASKKKDLTGGYIGFIIIIDIAKIELTGGHIGLC